jgi:3-oxoacyl-[acyl-carrier-protein] synthase-3
VPRPESEALPGVSLAAPAPVSAAIAGLGLALPEHVLSNDDVAALLDVDDAWIRRRTGISSRRRVADDQTTTDLATDAALAALEDACVDPEGVDLVVVATMTPDHATPQVAPLVAHRIGAPAAGAFDVAAACTAWLSALGAAAGHIESGRASCAVVVGVDVLSRRLDGADRSTAILFADGAGAAVLGPDEDGAGLGPLVLGSDGGAAGLITCPIGGTIAMDGHATFQRAVEAMSGAAERACGLAEIEPADVDLVVPHQANSRIIAAVGDRLGVEPDRLVDVMETTGNTSAATLPIALRIARDQGRLFDGARILLAAFGAGLMWGAGIVTWKEA